MSTTSTYHAATQAGKVQPMVTRTRTVSVHGRRIKVTLRFDDSPSTWGAAELAMALVDADDSLAKAKAYRMILKDALRGKRIGKAVAQ